MGIHDDYQEGNLVARFWFDAPNELGTEAVKYALTLYDTDDPVIWSGNFPPADGETITRTAESWATSPAKRKVKHARETDGDFPVGDEVTVTLSHEDQHLPVMPSQTLLSQLISRLAGQTLEAA